MGEDTEYINIYIQKQSKAISELNKDKLINETKLDLITKKFNDLKGIYENEKKTLTDKVTQLTGEITLLEQKNTKDVTNARQEYIDKYKDSIHTVSNLEKKIRELDKTIKDQNGIINALETNLKNERDKNNNLEIEKQRLTAKVNSFNTRKRVSELAK